MAPPRRRDALTRWPRGARDAAPRTWAIVPRHARLDIEPVEDAAQARQTRSAMSTATLQINAAMAMKMAGMCDLRGRCAASWVRVMGELRRGVLRGRCESETAINTGGRRAPRAGRAIRPGHRRQGRLSCAVTLAFVPYTGPGASEGTASAWPAVAASRAVS